MRRLLTTILLALPPLALAQETTVKGEMGNMYFLGIGLVIFLALIGVFTIFEKIRDWLDAKNELAVEAARKLRLENNEREAKSKSGRNE